MYRRGKYPKDVTHLSVSNKVNCLLKQAALNENVSYKSIHISLKFDRSEATFLIATSLHNIMVTISSTLTMIGLCYITVFILKTKLH